MRKFFLFIVFLYAGLVLFMPKINLYYTLENLAKKELVEIKEGSLKDNWVELDSKDTIVYYDGIASIHADEVKVLPWIFYNKIIALGVSPTKEVKKMFDIRANEVVMTYSVLDYKNIIIKANGDFGTIEGTFDIFAQKVRLILVPSKKFKNNSLVKEYFKIEEEGLVYESSL